MPTKYPVDDQQFLWEGLPAFVTRTSNVITLQTLRNNRWESVGNWRTPEDNREDTSNAAPTPRTKYSAIQVFNSPDGVHLFVHNDGLLFHRKGLDGVPLPTTENTSETKSSDSSDKSERLKAKSNDDDLAGWTRVRERPVSKVMGVPSMRGLMVDGKPVALIVDGVTLGNAVGRLYELEGDKWIEFASKPFPFGSSSFATVTTLDSKRSYVGVKTPLGQSFFYAIDATGFRETQGSALLKTYGTIHTTSNYALWSLSQLVAFPVLALILGILLGICIAPTMQVFTNPDYQFGVQTARLASIGWRGFARLIDLGLIGVATFGVGYFLTRNFDWAAFAEALNLHVDHPTIPIASRIATVMAVWLVVIMFSLLISQAIWGVTPGKSLCRLKTVRTSLRPCGFAASLAREIVFFVDCCNFLCWTPGIVCIALTERRQRLGDLIADTIVVKSRSIHETN
jgi:uncharacterized RDD family membrane protein YckC